MYLCIKYIKKKKTSCLDLDTDTDFLFHLNWIPAHLLGVLIEIQLKVVVVATKRGIKHKALTMSRSRFFKNDLFVVVVCCLGLVTKYKWYSIFNISLSALRKNKIRAKKKKEAKCEMRRKSRSVFFFFFFFFFFFYGLLPFHPWSFMERSNPRQSTTEAPSSTLQAPLTDMQLHLKNTLCSFSSPMVEGIVKAPSALCCAAQAAFAAITSLVGSTRVANLRFDTVYCLIKKKSNVVWSNYVIGGVPSQECGSGERRWESTPIQQHKKRNGET
jgi:hypothetical protein